VAGGRGAFDGSAAVLSHVASARRPALPVAFSSLHARAVPDRKAQDLREWSFPVQDRKRILADNDEDLRSLAHGGSWSRCHDRFFVFPAGTLKSRRKCATTSCH
jgi:hypothetical protein